VRVALGCIRLQAVLLCVAREVAFFGVDAASAWLVVGVYADLFALFAHSRVYVEKVQRHAHFKEKSQVFLRVSAAVLINFQWLLTFAYKYNSNKELKAFSCIVLRRR